MGGGGAAGHPWQQTRRLEMTARILFFVYGCVAYVLFLLTFLYAIAFVGGFGVPVVLDGPLQMPFVSALLIDAGLLGVFAVQHSVMARPGFKRWWTRMIPKEAERSTYILFASGALIVLYKYWEPIGGVVWSVQSPAGQTVLYALFVFGWALVFLSSFLINHFDLFGLRQVWLQLRGQPYTPVSFGTPVFYRIVRHPLYVGLLLAFWSAPTMTLTHLVFAIATTLYILIAIQLEEHDLIAEHPEYAQYRKRVPMLLPFLK
jgi:methanethiol S-methyltransferase